MSLCSTREMTLPRPISLKLSAIIMAIMITKPILAEELTVELTGRVSVVDGDTLEMHGARIRLFGIDAPENGQTCLDAQQRVWRCGVHAARTMDVLVRNQTVVCTEKDTDRYGRIVAICLVGATDLGEALVDQGLAVAYRAFSKAYVPAENNARTAGRGIWGGEFQMPSDWRREQRSGS